MYRQLISKFENIISKKQGELELLDKQLGNQAGRLISIEKLLDNNQKVIILLQKASEYSREQMKKTIENIVTNALQVVFNNDMKFLVELGTRAGSPTAEFFVITSEGLKVSPLDAKGGGLVDVISAALRLAILELYQPKIDGPIIMDEVGKHISAEYAENFAYFLKEYGAQVKRQIILVTHNSALAVAGDKNFKVKINNGVSEVVAV
jgi:DNA repair ATPase RecN